MYTVCLKSEVDNWVTSTNIHVTLRGFGNQDLFATKLCILKVKGLNFTDGQCFACEMEEDIGKVTIPFVFLLMVKQSTRLSGSRPYINPGIRKAVIINT